MGAPVQVVKKPERQLVYSCILLQTQNTNSKNELSKPAKSIRELPGNIIYSDEKIVYHNVNGFASRNIIQKKRLAY